MTYLSEEPLVRLATSIRRSSAISGSPSIWWFSLICDYRGRNSLREDGCSVKQAFHPVGNNFQEECYRWENPSDDDHGCLLLENLQCTPYFVGCTLQVILRMMYIAGYTSYDVHCRTYHVGCNLYDVTRTLWVVHWRSMAWTSHNSVVLCSDAAMEEHVIWISMVFQVVGIQGLAHYE